MISNAKDWTGKPKRHNGTLMSPRATKRPSWNKFESDTKTALEAMGYSVRCDLVLQGNQVDLFAERGEHFTTQRILVECKDFAQHVGVEHVRSLYARLDSVSTRAEPVSGMLVSRTGFTADAQTYAWSVNIALLTLKQLLEVSFDPAPILTRIVTSFERSDLRQHYIDLNCQVTETGGSSIYKPAEQFFDRFLNETKRPGLALLGNFGTGKTSLCKHYSYILASRFANGTGCLFPIYVDLKDLSTFSDLERDLLKYIRGTYSTDATEKGFRLWLSHKTTLLILDGFDEMASRMDKPTINRELSCLTRFCSVSQCKVVIACRTHFFRTNVDERALGDMLRLHICDWGPNELVLYVTKLLPQKSKALVDTIRSTYNLEELAKTPLFLSMITATLPTVSGQVNTARLYQTYTDRWIEEQDYRSRLSPEDKEHFMEELAFEMFRSGQARIRHSEIPDHIKAILRIADYSSVEILDEEIRTCTFLVRDRQGEGLYYFVHKSYMEFFVGHKLAREIKEGKLDSFALPVSPEVAGFVADYFEEDFETLVRLMVGHSDSTVRANAARALGLVSFDTTIVNAFARCLQTESEEDPTVQRCLVDSLVGLKRSEATKVVIDRCSFMRDECSAYCLDALGVSAGDEEVISLYRSILAECQDARHVQPVLRNIAAHNLPALQADALRFCRAGWWRNDEQVISAVLLVIQATRDLELALMLEKLEMLGSRSEATAALLTQAKAVLQRRFQSDIGRDALEHKAAGLDRDATGHRIRRKYRFLVDETHLRGILENLYPRARRHGTRKIFGVKGG